MGLYELTADRALHRISPTNFAAERVLERYDLQAALRDNIGLIDDGLLVVAEEFGEFEDVRRRVDLLCVDRSGRLAVVELKRTEDGGHMELQALRYAAMVSTMTFDQLVHAYERHLHTVEPDAVDEARTRVAEFLDDVGGEDAILDRRVRIVLVSSGFDPQITTTVLWLTELYQLDITCVRLTPYRIDSRLVLDVQQVIPLPEAAEFTVRLRQRESAAREASERDWTPYVVVSPEGETDPLRKRRAVLAMVHALASAGVDAGVIAAVIPGSRFLGVDGELAGDALVGAFVAAYPAAEGNEGRWFFEAPVHQRGRTWVVSKRWGINTEATLRALSGLAPGFGFRPVRERS